MLEQRKGVKMKLKTLLNKKTFKSNAYIRSKDGKILTFEQVENNMDENILTVSSCVLITIDKDYKDIVIDNVFREIKEI